MSNSVLSYDERKTIVSTALFNWCVNTDKHLTEARRLKAEKARCPLLRRDDLGRIPESCLKRLWVASTIRLIDIMSKEIKAAEPETAEVVGTVSWEAQVEDFLDSIPDEP